MGKILSLEQAKVIAWIEQYWLSKKMFPPEGAFKSHWPRFNLKESLTHPIFLKALQNRGISLPENSNDLSQEQIAAIATVANFADTRPRTRKLRDLGVTPAKWQGWMKNKAFKSFLFELTSTNFKDSEHIAQESIVRAMERGSVDAVKFYLEATGKYSPQSQEILNIRLILSRILEAIQMHVKDPVTIRRIQEDFEKIMTGSPPVERKELML